MLMLAGVLISRATFLGALSLLIPSNVLLDSTSIASSPPSPSFVATTSSAATADPYSSFANYVRFEVTQQVQQDPSIAGPLIRLAFHDAATLESGPGAKLVTGGPNGSIQYEMERSENRAIGRPLRLVQSIYSENPFSTTSTGVSLADAIAVGGAAAIEAVGGPHIAVRMGRTDASEAGPQYLRIPLRKSTPRSLVETTLPSAGLDSDGLRLYFGRLGLSEAEFVALSGSHGLGRHVSLLGMDKACLKNLTRTCLEEAPVLLPFVTSSVDTFDNSYFQALLQWNQNEVELGQVAFIPTDVALVVDRGLRKHVERFVRDQDLYVATFVSAYQKLVDSRATTSTRY
jgi:catalase (peroxidase I)